MNADVPTMVRSEGTAAMAGLAARATNRFAYVVDAEGVIEGWFDSLAFKKGEAEGSGVTLIDWREATIRPDASLKEALSRMLELGFRSIAVTDDQGHLLGDVALSGVEAVLTDSDSHVAPPKGGGANR
jgi:CBS domain-containing protein